MYFTIHTLDGDPNQLLAEKRSHFDPVVSQHAARFGAISTVTLTTDRGLTVYNLWRDADGARAFTALPEIQAAQQASGLPAPSTFVRHENVDGSGFISLAAPSHTNRAPASDGSRERATTRQAD